MGSSSSSPWCWPRCQRSPSSGRGPPAELWRDAHLGDLRQHGQHDLEKAAAHKSGTDMRYATPRPSAATRARESPPSHGKAGCARRSKETLKDRLEGQALAILRPASVKNRSRGRSSPTAILCRWPRPRASSVLLVLEHQAPLDRLDRNPALLLAACVDHQIAHDPARQRFISGRHIRPLSFRSAAWRSPCRPQASVVQALSRTSPSASARGQGTKAVVIGLFLAEMAEKVGFEPTVRLHAQLGFRDRPDRPLWHPLRGHAYKRPIIPGQPRRLGFVIGPNGPDFPIAKAGIYNYWANGRLVTLLSATKLSGTN